MLNDTSKQSNSFDWQLSSDDIEAWYFRPLENMQMHLAFLHTSGCLRLIFTNTIGHAFEEIEFDDVVNANRFLEVNGFKSCASHKGFLSLFSHPTEITKFNWYQEQIYAGRRE